MRLAEDRGHQGGRTDGHERLSRRKAGNCGGEVGRDNQMAGYKSVQYGRDTHVAGDDGNGGADEPMTGGLLYRESEWSIGSERRRDRTMNQAGVIWSLVQAEERRVKLELLGSLARSQHAIASILESVAAVAEHTPQLAKHIRDNIRVITGLQETLTEAVSGISWRSRQKRHGLPPAPWLASGHLRPAAGAGREPLHNGDLSGGVGDEEE